MHPVRRRRLNVIILLLGVLSIAIALLMYALRQNISLFYSPSQLLNSPAQKSQLIRLGGLVVPGSVKRDTNSLLVHFEVSDNQKTISIDYQGILPDLFKEGQSIVTQGYYLGNKEFKAVEVLAKHDEKYMPPEVKSSLLSETSKKVPITVTITSQKG
ncbi:MAG: cytochrome c maturation protein CcmE [Legionellaceae bacterium]|nr:cytochrome c maturation protein CcmE [Legionellaceae bacterium]